MKALVQVSVLSLILMAAPAMAGVAAAIVAQQPAGSVNTPQSASAAAMISNYNAVASPALFDSAAAAPGALVSGNTVTVPVTLAGETVILVIDRSGSVVSVKPGTTAP